MAARIQAKLIWLTYVMKCSDIMSVLGCLPFF